MLPGDRRRAAPQLARSIASSLIEPHLPASLSLSFSNAAAAAAMQSRAEQSRAERE